MTVSINGVAIPQRIRDRGNYVVQPNAEVRRNGAGARVGAGVGRARWEWTRLSKDDFAYWATTVCQGQLSRTVPAVLWDATDNEVSYSSVTISYPTYEGREVGFYLNVVVEFEAMVKA